MSTEASASVEASLADLTARARIRHVALAQFAERGSTATTIRGVARAAGVSPSLVQHHFGTKEGLRKACDAYVMQQLRQGVARGVTEQALADPAFVAETRRTAPVVLRYLARALTDGWPAATTLFDQSVALTEAHLTGQGATAGQSTRNRAAVFTAMKLGVVVLHEQLSRAMAIDTLSPDGMSQVSDAVLDIVSPAFIGKDLADAARHGNTGGPPESAASSQQRP
ncbi:TetR/AcrR family transcriptional regulator [Phytoactinopolyspora mesophila]|uniref:TetR family transcriptional regulator n=1 Tax=Phytoactinopolyspora mesophila TaxID=2650750 RepID=A0A7K3M8A0_9ACTN|nr:TetR family transcriptional regulator [Phytoactinopolyspora mesophila]NDL59483.1 TetR family transcriptional regulator [Phytoactinopolyspora mesophila]